MNLSKEMQELLADEIHFVVQKMKATADSGEKLYLFSAVPAMANRISNIEFDPELAFIHFVLNAAFGMINARIAAISQRQESGIAIPDNLFSRLEEALEELLAKIARGEKTYPVLERIAILAFSTTGNGYYLYSKGLITI